MNCREAINENPVFCLPEDTVDLAARVMRRERIGSIPVVTDEHRRELVGIISDRDLALKVVGESRDAGRTSVYDVMTHAVIACRDDDDLLSAIRTMEDNSLRRIPVVDYAGSLVGIISHEDVSPHLLPRQPVVRNLWQAA